MKKKIILIFTAIALVAVLASCLVACNKGYNWKSVGGGDANAEVVSNGGYVVKQGNYLYFINGYVGNAEDNSFGTPVKQAIVRVELKDGKPDNSTAVVVAPKSVYNTSKKDGIAIYGEWVYYVTNNNEKDKTGTASTTDSDFMRTKIDGSVTQRIATINSRSVDYFFTPTRVWYYESNVLSYVDFSGMKTSGDITNGKGAVSGKLDATISSVVWDYSVNKIFYTRSAKDDNTSMTYNELCSIDLNGANDRVLATIDTYLAEGESANANPQKVFSFTLLDVCHEADGSATIYYTKTHKLNETKSDGLYMNKVADAFIPTNEKLLSTYSSTTLYPLGYAEGALAYNSQSVYCWYNGEKDNSGNLVDPLQVTGSSITVWFVRDGYAYYTASSSASALYKIRYNVAENANDPIIEESMKIDWLALDVIGDDLYYFATSDNSYVHYIDYLRFNKDAEDAKSEMIGIYLDSEKPAED
ncbi:MAG: hypothetical protein J5815_03900 [Clostridia bacterium]|nr:hypothetical protein [Clostridia bacterium]